MEGVKVGGVFVVECIRKDGTIKWKEKIENLVTNVGLQHMLDVVFAAASQVATWYVGLAAATPTVAAGDTLTSHAGWTEFTNYTGNRQEWVDVRSGQTVTNSASKATFPVTQDSSVIGGAFLASASSGTSGTLMCGGAFSGGNKSADNGDTLNVTYSFSAADDGV